MKAYERSRAIGAGVRSRASRRHPGRFAGLAIVALVASAHAESQPVAVRAIGQIHVKGEADLGEGAKLLRIRSGAQPYFGGDLVAARADSSVTMTVRGGGVTLGPNAAARIALGASAHRISLERGTARIHFEPGEKFEVAVGALRVRPAASAGTPGEIDALISFDEGIGAAVGCRAGGLVVVTDDGAEPETIATGETRSFALAPAALPDVAAPSEEPPLAERVGAWVARGVIAGGVGYAAYEAVSEDDDEDEGSPSTN